LDGRERRDVAQVQVRGRHLLFSTRPTGTFLRAMRVKAAVADLVIGVAETRAYARVNIDRDLPSARERFALRRTCQALLSLRNCGFAQTPTATDIIPLYRVPDLRFNYRHVDITREIS